MGHSVTSSEEAKTGRPLLPAFRFWVPPEDDKASASGLSLLINQLPEDVQTTLEPVAFIVRAEDVAAE